MTDELREALRERAAAKEKERHARKTFDVPGVGKMEFVFPGDSKLLELIELMSADSSTPEMIEFSKNLIYDTCPDLHDQALQEEFGVVNPPDIVSVLMDVIEINNFAGQLIEWFGVRPESAENTAKNS